MTKTIMTQIKKIAREKAKDYNARFIKSQETIAIEKAKEWCKQHPFDEYTETIDEYNARLSEYITDFISQTPDEMLFNMRVMAQSFGTIFNMLASINTGINNMADLYKICNEQKITAWARAEAKRVKAEMIAKQEQNENNSQN